jgi:uncharacterized protein
VRASLFNVAVPLPEQDQVFVFNTFSDAQALVSRDVADLLTRVDDHNGAGRAVTADERHALDTLRAEGFVVHDHDAERAALRAHFAAFREDAAELRITVLTTLQCNFACEYCVQGDRGAERSGERMSLETAARTLAWIEERLDAIRPDRFVLTFFGGEPLINLPVVYFLAERAWHACEARGVTMLIHVITNGLLLTPEVVDRLALHGLSGVKVTLDGSRAAHDASRPLRGGQGTFDRIVENIRRVAGRCRIAIGGNFDVGSSGSFIELLDYLASQDFAPMLDKVAFKPVIRPRPASGSEAIPLRLVTRAGGGFVEAAAPPPATPKPGICDSCHFAAEQMIALRQATADRGFRTTDGIHMGPCELYRRHAHTIGPDGTLFACPGFAGEHDHAIGHVADPLAERYATAVARFEGLSPWRDACGDCAFVPVCGGGCSVASQAEQGTLAAPSCHKTSLEAGVAALARDVALGCG